MDNVNDCIFFLMFLVKCYEFFEEYRATDLLLAYFNFIIGRSKLIKFQSLKAYPFVNPPL